MHATELAIKYVLSGERGPVAVLYSSGVFSGTVEPEGCPFLYPTEHQGSNRESALVGGGGSHSDYAAPLDAIRRTNCAHNTPQPWHWVRISSSEVSLKHTGP